IRKKTNWLFICCLYIFLFFQVLVFQKKSKHAFMPRKFLVGIGYVLASVSSELVGGLLGLIPTKYQLNNT
ncbi:hypothetical protein BUY22_13145, partial [Staphylococcus cohnii]